MISDLFDGANWHQRWEVEPGIYTPGTSDVAELLQDAGVPHDLTGQRILDIGAWDGCCSFECERRGAREIIAIGPEDPNATGFNRLRAYLNSKVIYQYGSAYNLDPAVYGHFDVVLFFGVFYHLRYPLLALDNIRRVARGSVFFESSCIDEDTNLDGRRVSLAQLNPMLDRVPLLQFFRNNELSDDPSNWFSPNSAAVRDMLISSGFTPIRIVKRGVRIRAAASVSPGWPEFLSIASGENIYYNLFVAPLAGSKTEFYKG